MKKIIILLLFYNNLSAQNLITNGSFELGNSTLPDRPGQLDECLFWKSLSVGTDCSSPAGSSPDWYKSSNPFFRLPDVSAKTGQGYIGTGGTKEIIQQNFSNTLTPGRYRLKMFVRASSKFNSGRDFSCVLNDATNPACFFPFPCDNRSVHGSLNIFISKSKILYKNFLINKEKQGDIQPIANIEIPEVAQDGWVEIKKQFLIINENMQWIGIEGVNKISSDFGYTCIDDVSFEKIPVGECNECSTARNGAINIGIGNMQQPSPLRFNGLKNVTYFKMTASDLSGAPSSSPSLIQREIELFNPPCYYDFNHRTANGQSLDVNVTYSVFAYNDCDVVRFSFKSSNPGATIQLQNIAEYSNYVKLNPVDNCCSDELELRGGYSGTYLTNVCLNLSQYIGAATVLPRLTFKARQKIIVKSSTELSTLKNMDLIAPIIEFNAKTFSSPMKILEGNFMPRNDCPIPISPLVKNNTEAGSVINAKDLFSKRADMIVIDDNIEFSKIANSHFSLYPNPNSGKFTLNFEGFDDQSVYDIGISDTQGKIVYKSTGNINVAKEIDLSPFPTGIYLIKVVAGDKVFYQKCNRMN
jgi:Secretion system C-terminal sorting domain